MAQTKKQSAAKAAVKATIQIQYYRSMIKSASKNTSR